MHLNSLKIVSYIFLLLLFFGCSEHKVDTFEKWCESISGENLKAKYAPFWAIKLSVSVDEERIRNDFVFFLNSTLLKKVSYRAPRMAWEEETELHVVNLSSLLEVDPEVMIQKWRRGIERTSDGQYTDTTDACLYGTMNRLFTKIQIHTRVIDTKGITRNDVVTVILTKHRSGGSFE